MDPIELGILWDRLVAIVDEASVVQYRTAFSTVVREANDFACTILDARGDALANSETGLPSFVGTQPVTLKHMLTVFPVESLHPGDVLITNDPWIATGQAMDLTLFRPIFCKDRVVAFAGSVAHSPELGGAQRWNVSSDVFEEALRLPPMKLCDAGEMNETLTTLIRANSRLPDLTMGDLEAQLAALHLTNNRLLEVMKEYGLQDVEAVASEIYARSEDAIRTMIQTIRDGVYTAEIWSEAFRESGDHVRGTEPEPVLIHVAITVDGSELTLDFGGSSAQRRGSFNSVATFSAAYAAYGVRTILAPFLPNNAGFYRPLRIVCPEGSVVNARFPAPTLSRHVIGHQVCDATFAALASVLPDRVMAGSGSAPVWDLLLMGADRDDRPFHRLILINGGTGATAEQDGYTAGFPGNFANTPIEVMEALMPLLWECKEVIQDSAGAGRRRGGFGQRMVARSLHPDIGFSLINARVSQAPIGLMGGLAGRTGGAYLGDRPLPAGSDGTLAPGERLLIETPGGGGLGPPLEREPDRVLSEVVEGLISETYADSVYGVVITPDNLEVDSPGTSARRIAMQEDDPDSGDNSGAAE